MNAPRLHTLALFLAAGLAGLAQAGTGDITKRDQGGGSVELSNLGTDEDAAVVVAAPARAAVEPVARPMPGPASRPAPEVAAADGEAKAQGDAKRKKKDEENADEQTGDGRDNAASGEGMRNGYASFGGGLGGYGYGSGSGTGSTGGIDTGSTGGINTGSTGGIDTGTTSGTGGSAGGSGTTPVASGNNSGGGSGTGYVSSNTSGAGSAPTVGLSPDQMALRVAQYRDAMLNEQRGANGLVANPAVQRRYLMINRAGYMGLGY